MGAAVSVELCKAEKNVTLNCNATPGLIWGNVQRGEFNPDADIAGIGIVSVFITVTSLALIIGIADVFWQLYKSWWKKRGQIWQFHEDKPREARTNPSVSDIFETIVISCSDQQLFTGGAYALTVRYFKACSVSAYHYNILVNGLLITCATHLVAVTVVMNYWRYPLMAAIRVSITVLIFLVTGLLLTKRTGTGFGEFPIAIPPLSNATTGSPLFLPAACFETDIGSSGLTKAVQNSLDNLNSTTRGPDQAWTLYISMLLWWALAVIAESLRFLRRGAHKATGRRGRLVRRVGSWATGWQEGGEVKRKRLAAFLKRLFHVAFTLYLLAGLAISTVVVVLTAIYIQGLRNWVNKSGWLNLDDTGRNPENDVTTFGQLVPILMSALTLFAFMQMLSEKLSDAKAKRRYESEYLSKKDSSSVFDPFQDDKKSKAVVSVASVTPTPGWDNGATPPAWGATTWTPTSSSFMPGTGATPLIGGGSTPGLGGGSTPGFGPVSPLQADEIGPVGPATPPKDPSANRNSVARPPLRHERVGSHGRQFSLGPSEGGYVAYRPS